MPLVKADRVAQRDGPRLVRVGRHESKMSRERRRLTSNQSTQSRSVQSHEAARCYYVASGVLDSRLCSAAALFLPAIARRRRLRVAAGPEPGARDGEALPAVTAAPYDGLTVAPDIASGFASTRRPGSTSTARSSTRRRTASS